MKQIALAGIVILSFIISVTSEVSAQNRMGIKVGFNRSNVLQTADGRDVFNNAAPGIHIGLTKDVEIGGHFIFQPALLFSTKGIYSEVHEGTAVAKFYQIPYYLELPLNFLYNRKLGSGNLFAGAGPYLSYAVGGQYIFRVKDGSDVYKKTGRLSFTDNLTASDLSIFENLENPDGLPSSIPYSRPFDFGVGVIAGYELFQKIPVSLGYQFGLYNIMPTYEGRKLDNTSMKNIQFQASIGYKF